MFSSSLILKTIIYCKQNVVSAKLYFIKKLFFSNNVSTGVKLFSRRYNLLYTNKTVIFYKPYKSQRKLVIAKTLIHLNIDKKKLYQCSCNLK